MYNILMMTVMMLVARKGKCFFQAHTSYLWDPVRKVLDLTKVKEQGTEISSNCFSILNVVNPNPLM